MILRGGIMEFHFERGGMLTAQLLPSLAPETVDAVMARLPLEVTIYHSRWSGREINFPIRTCRSVPRERQTCSVNTGDVIYWKEWELERDANEALALYYGAEVTRDHRGFLPVNVFARISQDQWAMIEEIGRRVWLQGTETLRVSSRDGET